MRQICVIGGSGFIGSHFLRLLEQEKDVRVKALCRKLPSDVSAFGHINWALGDLFDISSLIRFLEAGAFVVNLAYLNNRSPDENVQAVLNLASACGKAGVDRLIHISTAVVVGRNRDNVITEVTTCRPRAVYEETKLRIEQSLMTSNMCHVTILRPSEVFGERGKGLVQLANRLKNSSAFANGLNLSLHNRRRLNLVYVENVVGAIWFLLTTQKDTNGQCYIVSEDDVPENNYEGVVKLLAQFLNVDAPRAALTCPPRIFSTLLRLRGRSNTNPCRVFSCEKLLQLGYRRAVPFKEGVQRFAQWYGTVSSC